MRLNREQYGIVAEIKARARRMYRLTMQAEKTGLVRDDALAELYIDGQVTGQYTSMLWKQSGDAAKAEQHAGLDTATASDAGQHSEVVQTGEDDPPAEV